jgi:glutathione S-transferase
MFPAKTAMQGHGPQTYGKRGYLIIHNVIDFSIFIQLFRYVLDFKGIPYKIIQFEYCDIESGLRAAGVGPSGKRMDGSDLYTVPSIVDTITGAKVTDSIKIALYLEETYPDTPSIFPHGTPALHQAFFAHFNSAVAPIWSTILPRIPDTLDDRAKKWFIELRTRTLGRPLAEIDPIGEKRDELFRQMKETFGLFDGFYQKNGGGHFIMGTSPGFTDLMIAGVVQGLKVWGTDSQEWKDFSTWNGGRWVKLLDVLESYGSQLQEFA